MLGLLLKDFVEGFRALGLEGLGVRVVAGFFNLKFSWVPWLFCLFSVSLGISKIDTHLKKRL